MIEHRLAGAHALALFLEFAGSQHRKRIRINPGFYVFMKTETGNSGKQSLTDNIADQTKCEWIIWWHASGGNTFSRGLKPKLGHIDSMQKSFIEFALIDEFFAAGKGNYRALHLLTNNDIDSQAEKNGRNDRARQ